MKSIISFSHYQLQGGGLCSNPNGKSVMESIISFSQHQLRVDALCRNPKGKPVGEKYNTSYRLQSDVTLQDMRSKP